jgi:hypothetical protein
MTDNQFYKKFGRQLTTPTRQAELDGIERFVRDTNNACGCGDSGWDWDFDKRILTITEENGSRIKITGYHIAETNSHDKRFDRLWTPNRSAKRKN